MTVDLIQTRASDSETLRAKNGVESELFGYLHPRPDHDIEIVKNEKDSSSYLHCLTDGKVSGPLKPLRINNS